MQSANGSNLKTEDDYSIKGHTKQGNFLSDISYQDVSTNHVNTNLDSSLMRNDCSRNNGSSSGLSQHSLESVNVQLKQRISELGLVNESLQRRLKVATSSSMDQNSSSQLISSSHELEVTKAWEAYSVKCRECEKLRDDLMSAEQRLQETQSVVRGQTHREDMMRAQSQQDEYRKKLQQLELEIRDRESKTEMAKEELRKEKEYLETVLQATKERHDKMENTIKSQQTALLEKDQQHQELIRDIETQRQMIEDKMKRRENQLKERLHETEGKVLREREERSLLEAHIAELEQWKREMENFHSSSGLPLHIQQVQKEETDCETNSNCSDIDPAELVLELRSLTEEMNVLKQQASLQSAMLSKICEDPKIQESISSLNCNGWSDWESTFDATPVQCSEQPPFSQTTSAFPTMDTRTLVDGSPQPSYNDLSPRPAGDAAALGGALFAVSRQIHTADTTINPRRSDSPQQIEIPPIPENLSHAFNNIGLAKTAESASSNHLQVASGQLSKASNGSSLSSDPGTDSSNTDTLVDPVATSPSPDSRQLPPDGADDGVTPLYRPPTSGQEAQPSDIPNAQMKAVWPNYSAHRGSSNLAAMWPPDMNFPSGSSSASLEPVHRPTAANPSNELLNSSFARNARPLEQGGFVPGPHVREFKVQPVNRPVSHVPPFPNALPILRLATRARASGAAQTSAASSSRRQVDRTLPPAAPGQENGATCVTASNPHRRSCPVCYIPFLSDATESYMQRHINGHFSEEEDIATVD